MTLEEKVGQMIGWRYNGRFFNRDSDAVKELIELIVKEKIGGLIIFAGEVYETAHLTNFLQEKARIPLLIAADFEWGAAMRINGTALFPPLMALGATDSEELANEMGKITAIEGRAMGIHMTYAPVVDVNINPDNPVISARSLGERPESVGRLAAAFIRGCQKNGMIATAKHFPGHGDTAVDSHNDDQRRYRPSGTSRALSVRPGHPGGRRGGHDRSSLCPGVGSDTRTSGYPVSAHPDGAAPEENGLQGAHRDRRHDHGRGHDCVQCPRSRPEGRPGRC
jgi:hypothetical protein